MVRNTSLAACLLLLGVRGVLSAATPKLPRQDECGTRSQRKSWTALTDDEKADYIKADLCLMEAPAKGNIPGAVTRWDELQYAHAAQADYIHGVGAFLPFHRFFTTVHERLLRDECGYTGPMAYWDEVADMANLAGSAIFDPTHGFGGNGAGDEGCVEDGPFANLTLRFQPDLSTADQCLTRALNPLFYQAGQQIGVDVCLLQGDFTTAWNCLEFLPHAAGHGGVGGTMVNVLLSPGDPIFYLHHTYLDKLWWDWQAKDLPKRLTEIAGNNTPNRRTGLLSTDGEEEGDNSTALPPGFDMTALEGGKPRTFADFDPDRRVSATGALEDDPAFTDYFGDDGPITTLNHNLWSAGIMENKTIAEVMDIASPFVCAEYI